MDKPALRDYFMESYIISNSKMIIFCILKTEMHQIDLLNCYALICSNAISNLIVIKGMFMYDMFGKIKAM